MKTNVFVKSIIVSLMLCASCAPSAQSPHAPDTTVVYVQPPAAPAPTCAPAACPIPTSDTASTDPLLAPIVFKEGSAILTHNDEQFLNVVAAHIIENYVGTKIRVEGMALDVALARARAREVVLYLTSKGVPSDSLIRTSRIGTYNRVQFVPSIEQ
jgi:outer membrane protein OmpA-like peptidoglycan-associated protein